MDSLIKRLGGISGLERLVDSAYERVLADPELQPFFANSDTEKLKRMQHVFLEAALSDDTEFRNEGRSIREAHHGRDITRQHFTRFVDCFLKAMEANETVDQDDIDQVIGRLNTFVDEVVGSSSVDG